MLKTVISRHAANAERHSLVFEPRYIDQVMRLSCISHLYTPKVVTIFGDDFARTLKEQKSIYIHRSTLAYTRRKAFCRFSFPCRVG